MLRQAVRRTDKEVSGANGGIANLESQDGLLGFCGRLALDRLLNYGVEGRIQQALHERVRRVVRAGCLALIAHHGSEGKEARVEFHGWIKFQKTLVDAPQLFAPQVPIVHQTPSAAVLNKAQVADGLQKVLVGEFGGFQIGHGCEAKQEAPEDWEPQCQATVIPQFREDQPHSDPEIGVQTTASALRHPAQPPATVKAGITGSSSSEAPRK